MSAPKDDALAAAVANHGPFPMPLGEPMPVELTEQQLDALSAAGNRALNDHYHEDLCYCRSWPTKCESSGGYFMGTWDTAAFDIGLPAVLGMWETLRNDRHAAKIAELRARVAQLEAQRAAVLALHRKHDDSAHCVADDETWPCLTRSALGASSETECPSCAAPADVAGYRIPQHRDGCPQAVAS
ncbi:hypothetical protein ABT007_20005 [Streptomyces griseus]|uniref:hypothetical protein n=1 Tax=Streptomyces griseus TaxID=1911 RepID=UPI00333166DF